MFIKVDNIYYCVNVSKYKGSEQFVTNKVVTEIMSRMNLKSTTIIERQRLRTKIYNQYIKAKNAA